MRNLFLTHILSLDVIRKWIPSNKISYLYRDSNLSLMEKNYSKLFGESLFKTIKNCYHYSPMLNWRTIGGTIEVNRQKLLKCSNYSPIVNYTCRRGRAYLK